MEIDKTKIYTISEFVQFLNEDLKWMKTKIVGEVGEAKAGPTGHMYFTLKDEKDGAMLNCIMWSSKYRMFGITLEPGKKIVAFGCPSIYAPAGKLSFIADTIELAGEGDIKKQYDELKLKLTNEGLFNVENKRLLPQYPHKIGVITSKNGAVIHDFINNIGRFGFDIKMIDSRVEGAEAVADLLGAIKTFRKKDIDVLVIIRGGGSMESLQCFNNEMLVREIVGFPVPVIAGIGHDKDVPLAAMAADVMVSTPTAAANLLNKSWNEALLLLERYERDILGRYEIIIRKYVEIENRIKLSLQKFRNSIISLRVKVDSYANKYSFSFNSLLIRINERLMNTEKIIAMNNPERQLKLGYSIATINGKIVRKKNDAKIGENLEVKVFDGTINSEIKDIK